MKSFLKLLLIIAGIFLLSAFLAPILYKFLPFKFHRIFNRLIMIFTLLAVGIAVYRKALAFPAEAFRRRPESLRLFFTAFTAGFLTLLLLVAVKMAFEVVRWNLADKTAWEWTTAVLTSFAAALLIGIIEECFFRGFVYTTLRKKAGWSLAPAFVVTNLFYSLIHFVGHKRPFIGPDPGFKDGLKLAIAPFAAFTDWQALWPDAIGLFIFGCILSLLFLRTGSLYPSIGLHAGCVFYLKMNGAFSFHKPIDSLFFGTGDGYDGILGWLFLAAMGALLIRLMPRPSPKPLF